MKKTITLALCACFVLSFTNVNAKIRRVGFFANQIANQDYTSLQAAHDASNSGDTLLIFPGSWSANFSKKLVVIGYGYFTASNKNLQVITGDLSIAVYMYNGSANCIFEGLDNFLIRSEPNNSMSNIVINRCNVEVRFSNLTYTNWQIRQCYVRYIGEYYGQYIGLVKNLLVENCFISRVAVGGLTYGQLTGTFKNNVFGDDYFDFYNGSFALVNNIVLEDNAGHFVNTANCTFKNNIGRNGFLPAGNGNKPNIDITKVCVGYPDAGSYSLDARFQLKPNSPASGAGEDGEDCGMFGGPDPYRLSGIPGIPSFYKLSASSSTASANPYTITFSVRGNN